MFVYVGFSFITVIDLSIWTVYACMCIIGNVQLSCLHSIRDSAALNSPLFVQLVNSLHGAQLLSKLWTCKQSQYYDIVRLVRRVCVQVIHLLPEIMEQTKYPGKSLNHYGINSLSSI